MSIAPDPNATQNYGPPPGYGQQTPPASQTTSGLSIAGLILAFIVAPIGFILSIVALVKIKSSGQKGKGLAIAGVIVSVLGMIGWALIIATIIAVAPTAAKLADPGCIDGKAAITQNQPTGTDPEATKATINKAISELNAAAAKSKHEDVKAAITAVADDYTQMMQAAQAGDSATITQLQTKLEADAAKIDSLCTIGGK
jgi:Co/Zn/Cd efflux system component